MNIVPIYAERPKKFYAKDDCLLVGYMTARYASEGPDSCARQRSFSSKSQERIHRRNTGRIGISRPADT